MERPLALVTGASRGLGRAVALELAARGWRVLAGVRNPGSAPEGTQALDLDVASAASIGRAAAMVAAQGQPLRLLVNNAGVILAGDDSVLTVAPELILQTFASNLLGPLAVAQALAPCMATGGRIVNVSSAGGQLSTPSGWSPAYCLSKTALNGVTVQLAQALEPAGIAVYAVCPGWVRTDMGGADAPRSVAEGAASILWACLEAPPSASGGFFRDGQSLPW